MKEILDQLKARKITQRAFCKKLDVSETQFSQWKSGYRNPGRHTVTAMKLILSMWE